MEYLYEKVAYLRGLAEGLAIEESGREGKLLLHIVDALEDFADAINDLSEEKEELEEYVEVIDEDLADVEEELFGEDDDEDYEDYDDIDYVEYVCPHCNETIYLDKDLLDEDGETECPNCHKTIVCD